MENGNSGVDESYYTLLMLIGALCITLPLVLILGALIISQTGIQSSLSAYYYTNMRDYFIGFLIAVGIFLITVRGYEKIDDIMASISGICLIGIAVFPTSLPFSSSSPSTTINKVGIFQLPDTTSFDIHITLACICFVSLAIICLFLFTRKVDNEKPKGYITYMICGIVMILGMVFYVFTHNLLLTEIILLLAFGIAWLVKGVAVFGESKTVSNKEQESITTNS